VETAEPARFRRVLVPLDGSEAAEEILDAAERVAEAFSSKLYLFRAVPGGTDATGEARRAEEYLRRWQERLERRGRIAPVEVRIGPAAEQALEAIRERGLDAVALTTHGRTGWARALYGSVAEKLLREAGVPILAIRNQALRVPAAPPAGRRPLLRVP
jgi:nucleotide-binding universal stress UspA family protein